MEDMKMSKTYEFKYDKRVGGAYTEFNDNGKITIVDKGFNPKFTKEIEDKKAEYESQGYIEKVSEMIQASRSAIADCDTKEEKYKVMDTIARSVTR
jgi:hypothetical protein